jgi:hypothetical protein
MKMSISSARTFQIASKLCAKMLENIAKVVELGDSRLEFI